MWSSYSSSCWTTIPLPVIFVGIVCVYGAVPDGTYIPHIPHHQFHYYWLLLSLHITITITITVTTDPHQFQFQLWVQLKERSTQFCHRRRSVPLRCHPLSQTMTMTTTIRIRNGEVTNDCRGRTMMRRQTQVLYPGCKRQENVRGLEQNRIVTRLSRRPSWMFIRPMSMFNFF